MSDLPSSPPADRSVKIPHLVFGLLFLGVAGVWAMVVTDVITEDRLPILAPAVLIVAGVIGLAASLTSTRNGKARKSRQDDYLHRNDGEQYDHRQDDPQPDHPADDTADDTQEIR